MGTKNIKPKRWLAFAAILRKHRNDLGYTQAEAARILNWTPSYYGQVEAGFILPGTDAKRLAAGRFLGWIRSNDDSEGRADTREWFASDKPRTQPDQEVAEGIRRRTKGYLKKR